MNFRPWRSLFIRSVALTQGSIFLLALFFLVMKEYGFYQQRHFLPQLIKFDLYFSTWLFLWFYCAVRPTGEKELKANLSLLISIPVGLALLEVLLIPDWGASWISNSIVGIFVTCSLLIRQFYITALREHRNPLINLFFSMENSYECYECLHHLFFILCFGILLIPFFFKLFSYLAFLFLAASFFALIMEPVLVLNFRWKAWKRAISLSQSRGQDQQDTTILFLVLDNLRTPSRSSAFNWTWRKRVRKGISQKTTRRDIDIITSIEALTFTPSDVETVALSPHILELLNKRVSFPNSFLVYFYISNSSMISISPDWLLEKRLKELTELTSRHNVFLLSYHVIQETIRAKNQSGMEERESHWISTLNTLAYNEDVNCKNINEPFHFLPESLKALVDDYFTLRHVWETLETTANRLIPALAGMLPGFIGKHLTHLVQKNNIIEIFYGLSKLLEMLVHFHALAAAAFVTGTRENRERFFFREETEGASIGHWYEIGKKYAPLLPPQTSIKEWWDQSLKGEVKEAAKRLLAAIGMELSRMRKMEDLHEFIVASRNKTFAHGIATRRMASDCLNDLAVITGRALACAVETGLAVRTDADGLIIKDGSNEMDVSDMMVNKDDHIYLLTAHHQGFPEFLCYQTGEMVYTKNFKIQLSQR